MKNLFPTKAAKIGFKIILSTAVLLLILAVIFSLLNYLPKQLRLLDLSENGMYSVSNNAKQELSKLDSDTEIFLLTSGGEDALTDSGIHINIFLQRLCSYNKKLDYKIINLSADSSFLESYGFSSSDISVPSIIISGEQRIKYIDSSDIFYYTIDGIGKVSERDAQLYQLYYGLTPKYEFAGESLVLGALSFVNAKDLPTAVFLTGHGESTVSENLKKNLENSGIICNTSSTLIEVPNCDIIIINAPKNDINTSEAEFLKQYQQNGGKLLLFTAPESSLLTNLLSVLDMYGLSYYDGIIIDTADGNFQQYPYYLTPSLLSHAAVKDFNSIVLLPFCHGINITEKSGINISEVLYTSPDAYLIPTTSTDVSMPEGTVTSEKAVCVIAEASNGSAITWIPSSGFTSDDYNEYTFGGNYDFITKLASFMTGASNKLSSNYTTTQLITEQLTMSQFTMLILAVLTIIVLPLLTVLAGAIYCIKRKRI